MARYCPEGGGGGRRRRDNSPDQDLEWGKASDNPDDGEPVVKQQPSFAQSGLLAQETNTVKGVELKFCEPTEARKPDLKWRIYVFKGDADEPISMFHIHRQSAFLFGRDRKIADIPVDHPSCSSQHCVLQFRLQEVVDEVGQARQSIRPYLMDLDSTNGTFIKNLDGVMEKIEATRYYGLKNRDVFRIGNSSREYVLLLGE